MAVNLSGKARGAAGPVLRSLRGQLGRPFTASPENFQPKAKDVFPSTSPAVDVQDRQKAAEKNHGIAATAVGKIGHKKT
jgi:hypothetical protein